MRTAVQMSQLRRGDIIVTTTRKLNSWFIRQVLGTDFSHAMLYLGGGEIVESGITGVSSMRLTEVLSDAELAIVLRRRNMTDSLRGQVVGVAKGFIGRDYDIPGAIGSALEKPRGKFIARGLKVTPLGNVALAIAQMSYRKSATDARKDKDFFCSELVARTYELVGKPLYDGLAPSYTNPREVRMSSKLLYIGHLKSSTDIPN